MLFYFSFSIYYNILFLKSYIFTGASTIEDCEAQITQLELVLDAKVISLLQPKFPSFLNLSSSFMKPKFATAN